jgi:hypothetical protein
MAARRRSSCSAGRPRRRRSAAGPPPMPAWPHTALSSPGHFSVVVGRVAGIHRKGGRLPAGMSDEK